MGDCIGILLDYLRQHQFFRMDLVLREEFRLRQQLNGLLVPWSDDRDLPLASTTKVDSNGYILDYLRRHHFSRAKAVLMEEISIHQELNGHDLNPPVASTSGIRQDQGAQMHHEVEEMPDK